MKIREKITAMAMLLAGALLYALAFDIFFEPNEIAFGGITGVAQVVNFYVPRITIGVWVIIFNIPLFLAGWKLFGRWMLLASLVAMFVSSALIDILPLLYVFPPMDDKLLACVLGGVLLGAGLALITKQGANTGGTEIIAWLLKLRIAWLPVGKLLLLTDLTVCVAVAIVFRNVQTAYYGVVALYISTFVMDRLLMGLDDAKVAYIISDDSEEITRRIIRQLDRTVTVLNGVGGFTGNEKKVIMCAFKQKQIVPLKALVKEVDPGAFMIVTSAHEVLGEGFRDFGAKI